MEKSDNITADNYRAEILGGIALKLLLKTITDGNYIYIPWNLKIQIGCKNNGVVHHCNKANWPLENSQAQADDTTSHSSRNHH